ncbi:hypothetical protein VNO80_02972 [Phaseolus coccineus]|uniref:Uncharacterized protein n=1 Tax=Phaseolus coccineus TaxID=3886 RepID=A0AAN9NR70_PHACN
MNPSAPSIHPEKHPSLPLVLLQPRQPLQLLESSSTLEYFLSYIRGRSMVLISYGSGRTVNRREVYSPLGDQRLLPEPGTKLVPSLAIGSATDLL